MTIHKSLYYIILEIHLFVTFDATCRSFLGLLGCLCGCCLMC